MAVVSALRVESAHLPPDILLMFLPVVSRRLRSDVVIMRLKADAGSSRELSLADTSTTEVYGPQSNTALGFVGSRGGA